MRGMTGISTCWIRIPGLNNCNVKRSIHIREHLFAPDVKKVTPFVNDFNSKGGLMAITLMNNQNADCMFV
jgi:hypothetical protein